MISVISNLRKIFLSKKEKNKLSLFAASKLERDAVNLNLKTEKYLQLIKQSSKNLSKRME